MQKLDKINGLIFVFIIFILLVKFLNNPLKP